MDEHLCDPGLKSFYEHKLSHQQYYYKGRLTSDPQPYGGQAEPKVIAAKNKRHVKPSCSIVIPVYNQEKIISRTLYLIAKHTEGSYELIIIADCCTDSTIVNILSWIQTGNAYSSGLTSIVLISQATPVFETTCDNIGFSIASSEFIIEIQADMRIHEFGYNTRLLNALLKYDDLIGVSGRCSHSFDQSRGIGKLGPSIEHKLQRHINVNTLYMFGTCNRGPLALRKSMLQKLGYLDEKNYFLDDSDHDLFARAFVSRGWKCGYVPIEVTSLLSDGSCRKHPSNKPSDPQSLNEKIRSYKLTVCNGGFLRNNHSLLQSVPIETRPL